MGSFGVRTMVTRLVLVVLGLVPVPLAGPQAAGGVVAEYSVNPQDYLFPADNYEQVLNEPLPYDSERFFAAAKLTHMSEEAMEANDPRTLWHPLVKTSVERHQRALQAVPEAKNRVAVMLTGGFRTLGEFKTRQRFHNYLLAPLIRAGYSLHLFAAFKLERRFSCMSPFAIKMFYEENSTYCLSSKSKYFRGANSPPYDAQPLSSVHEILWELVRVPPLVSYGLSEMNGHRGNVTFEEVDAHCCNSFKTHFDPEASLRMQSRCGSVEHFSQFYGTTYAYKLLRTYEVTHNTTFNFVIKMRADVPPYEVLFPPGTRLFQDSTEHHSNERICFHGDGAFTASRGFADILFSTHRSHDDCRTTDEWDKGNECPFPLPHNTSLRAQGTYSYPDCITRVHWYRYGLAGAMKVPNCLLFNHFWFVRPSLDPETSKEIKEAQADWQRRADAEANATRQVEPAEGQTAR